MLIILIDVAMTWYSQLTGPLVGGAISYKRITLNLLIQASCELFKAGNIDAQAGSFIV